MRKSNPSHILTADFAFRADEFVRVAGDPAGFEVEADLDPLKIDHVWITIHAGRFGRLRISVSTYSLKHATNGFDPRMRIGVFSSSWTRLPERGVFSSPGHNYAELERLQTIVYRETERPSLENLLRANTDRAILIEAWGALYLRDGLGIHQVHSRRASCSVRTDHVGRDGAVKFYFPDRAAEMVLFKYCGQV